MYQKRQWFIALGLDIENAKTMQDTNGEEPWT
jgi:hypothetical protein